MVCRSRVIWVWCAALVLAMGAGAAGETLVDSDIAADVTWTTVNSPYVVDGDQTVLSGVTLTIEPGVVVKFQESACLVFEGSLSTQTYPPQPVYFTSIKDDTLAGDTNGDGNQTVPSSNDWGGLRFVGTVEQSVHVEGLEVRYSGNAGGYIDPDCYGICLKNFGTATVRNCSLLDDVIPIAAHNVKDLTLQNVYCDEGHLQIEQCVDVAIRDSTFFHVGSFWAVASIVGDLVIENVEVFESVIEISCSLPPSFEASWYIDGSTPIDLDAYVPANTRLNIMPGSFLRMQPGSDIRVYGGTFHAVGTESLPIVFTIYRELPDGTVYQPTTVWSGISGQDSADIVLEHCGIHYTGGTIGGLQLVGPETTASVSNCSFEHCQSKAIDVSDYYETPPHVSITDCSFVDCGCTAIDLSRSSHEAVDHCGNTTDPEFPDKIVVQDLGCSTVPFDLPYVVTQSSSIPDGQSMEIEAGVEIFFDGEVDITVSGLLDVLGTAQQPVILMGAQATAETWGQIRIEETGSAHLSYCLLQHGGMDGYQDDPVVKSYGVLEMENCTVARAREGVYVAGGMCQVDNCVFWENSGGSFESVDGAFSWLGNSVVYNPGLSVHDDVTLGTGAYVDNLVMADPLFADPWEGDFTLLPNSCCIDAGNPYAVDPDGSRRDIGVYCFQGDGPGASVASLREQIRWDAACNEGNTRAIRGAVVCAVFNNEMFQVQDADGTAGIRVVSSFQVQPGDIVDIIGEGMYGFDPDFYLRDPASWVLQGLEHIEVFHGQYVCKIGETDPPEPVFIPLRMIGRPECEYDCGGNQFTLPVLGSGFGPENIGLFARTCGRVVGVNDEGTKFTLRDPAERLCFCMWVDNPDCDVSIGDSVAAEGVLTAITGPPTMLIVDPDAVQVFDE